MYAEHHIVDATTNASGDATVYSPTITGRIHAIRYVKDGSTPFANGVDFAITAEVSGQTVWTESDVNASKTVAPRQATHATDGTASLYAAAGEPVEDAVVVAKERIKIIVAQGGDTKTGRFHLIVT